MAEIVLGSLVERIVDQVASLIAQQVGLAWNLEAELAQLKDSLTMIQALLQDAEKKQSLTKPSNSGLGSSRTSLIMPVMFLTSSIMNIPAREWSKRYAESSQFLITPLLFVSNWVLKSRK